MMLDPFITSVAQYGVGLLMLAGGMHKMAHVERFAVSIAGYDIIPVYLEKPVAVLLIGVELVGASIVVPGLRIPAAVAAACLLVVYLAVMGRNLLRNQPQLDCGCSFYRSATPLSITHLIRTAAVLILALVAAAPDSDRSLTWQDQVQIAMAVACLALIYLCADALLVARASVLAMKA